jgi:hypothetical protein
MHHAEHTVLDGFPPLVVGQILEGALHGRACGVDEHV